MDCGKKIIPASVGAFLRHFRVGTLVLFQNNQGGTVRFIKIFPIPHIFGDSTDNADYIENRAPSIETSNQLPIFKIKQENKLKSR